MTHTSFTLILLSYLHSTLALTQDARKGSKGKPTKFSRVNPNLLLVGLPTYWVLARPSTPPGAL